MRYLNMQKIVSVSAALTCMLFAGHDAGAQRTRTGGARKTGRDGEAAKGAAVIKIRKFVGVGQQTRVKTPVYSTNARGSTKQGRMWARVTLIYDTAPEWIDELTFQYYVLSSIKKKGRTHYSLFKQIVKYTDIERGRNHMSTVFLSPRALKRYGSPEAVAVEISREGNVIERASEIAHGSKIPKRGEWWKNPKVVDSDAVTERDGYLLDRAHSPFALINIDDYEVIK